MAYWHAYNPWAARLTYIPSLEELALCLERPVQRVPSSWWQYGSQLDAYILPPVQHDNLCHSAGIRYGPDGAQYLSPYCNPERLTLLWRKYQP